MGIFVVLLLKELIKNGLILYLNLTEINKNPSR